MPSKKKPKEKFEDDGRVVADMDCEQITGYKSKKQREQQRALREMDLNRKERWAIYKGALQQFMPIFLMFMCSLVLIILFLYFFWIN